MEFLHKLLHGELFSRRDALDCGFTQRQVDHRLATGAWRRERSGLYVDATAAAAHDQRDEFLIDLLAAQRRVTDGVVSHQAAALLHDLPVFGPLEPLTLTRPATRGRTPAAYPGLRVLTAALPARDVMELDGLLVTTRERTVCDRARTSSFRSGVVTADAALRTGVERGELLAVLARCHRWPGKRRAVEVVTFADGRSESVLESVSRVSFRDTGVPAPALQVEIVDELGWLIGRVDFYWDEHGVVGEADGAVKYASSADAGVAALVAEKRRQERLEDTGRVVVRWGYEDILRRPEVTASRIHAAFARAARMRGPAA